MARIINERRSESSSIDRRKDLVGISKNRSVQELQIGLEAKKYLDSTFTTLVNAPTRLCRYYHTSSNETTFSETLNMQKDLKSATRFNKINNFVVWGEINQDEVEHLGKDAERDKLLTATDQTCIVLQGTVMPVNGDLLIFQSQGATAIIYTVTQVEQIKMVDKSAYKITIGISKTFETENDIEDLVVDEYEFVFGNIGTHKKTIFKNVIYKKILELTHIMDNLNNMYVEAFYDIKYDILRCYGISDSAIDKKKFITCKALRLFQDDRKIFTYGNDRNQLFSDYPVLTSRDSLDYKQSFYKYICDKRVVRNKEERKSFVSFSDFKGNDFSSAYLHSELELATKIDNRRIMQIPEPEMDRMSGIYMNIHGMTEEVYNELTNPPSAPEFDYKIKLFFTIMRDFNILTNFCKSDIELYSLNSTGTNELLEDREPFVEIECKNPMFTYIMDNYLNGNNDKVLNASILDSLIVSENSITDFLFIPIIMNIISITLDVIEEDEINHGSIR